MDADRTHGNGAGAGAPGPRYWTAPPDRAYNADVRAILRRAVAGPPLAALAALAAVAGGCEDAGGPPGGRGGGGGAADGGGAVGLEGGPAERRRAVLSMGSVAALARAADDPDPRVAEAALRRLADLVAPTDAQGRPDRRRSEAAPAFRRHLRHPDLLVRQRAVDGLARTAGRAGAGAAGVDDLPALVAALDDPYPPVAVAAAGGLARLRDPRAVPALTACLDRGDRAAADAVMTALGALRDPAAAPHVTPLLADRDPYLGASAERALAEMGLAAPDRPAGTAPPASPHRPPTAGSE